MATKIKHGLPARVNGDNILYRLLTDLIKQGGTHGQWLVEHIVADCSVWWDPRVYIACPVLLPWAVRDQSCRGDAANGIPDQWGAPNENGYFRDDNSLVKGLVKALDVLGPRDGYMTGKRLSDGWVASHIWRKNKSADLASRNPHLYTFVPNLVWLPRQISKLSDVEGGPVQLALKSISYQLYREASVSGSQHRIAERSWAYLDRPEVSSTVDQSRLSFFGDVTHTLQLRQRRTASVVSALEAINRGEALGSKVLSRRYSEGLPGINAEARDHFLRELKIHS